MATVTRTTNDQSPLSGVRAEEPTDVPARGWKQIALRVKDRYGEDHVALSAAGVAFFGFSALLPFLALAVTVYGLVADPSDVESVVELLGGVAPEDVAVFVGDQLEAVAGSSSAVLSLGVVVAVGAGLWAASSGTSHLVEAVNIAYDEDTDDRPFWKRRLLAIALTGWFAVSLGAIVTTISIGAALASGAVGVVVEGASWLLCGVIAAVALAGLYRYSPDRDEPEWTWVSPGAIFAIVAFLVVSIAFRVYVANFGSYNETYGSLGAVIVLLTWLYLTALVVILGAEINAESERQTRTDTTSGPDEPMGERDAVVADERPVVQSP